MFSIVLPFLAIVKLFVCQFAPSATDTKLPLTGDDGNVNVHAPPLVSAMIKSETTAEYVVILRE